MSVPSFEEIAWPVSQVSECLAALATTTGLAADGATPSPAFGPKPNASLTPVIEHAAAFLGCEAWQTQITFGSLEHDLPTLCPALLRFSDSSLIAITAATEKRLILLAPDLSRHRRAIAEVASRLRAQHVDPDGAEIARLLNDANIAPASRARVARLLSREQSDERLFDQAWSLAASPCASATKILRQSGLPFVAAGMVAAHVAQYLLWLASWAIMGRLSLSGRLDHGWLLAWALLLLTLIPFRLLTTWFQGLLAIQAGGLLKRTLLAGAMKLQPEEIKHCGIGDFLSQTLEAEAVETLALGGGLQGLLASIEIVLSAFVLGPLALALLAWCLLAAFLIRRFWTKYRLWTSFRLTLTHDLVENMLGHRTRLAQQPKHQWHQSEDHSHTHYFRLSHSLDRTGTLLISFLPRGWLVLGLACLVPGIVSHQGSTSSLAIVLGGVLLAFSAFRRLTWSFSEIAAAGVAWKRIAPLVHSATRPEAAGSLPTTATAPPNIHTADSPHSLLEAERLTYRYRSNGVPVLDQCSLTIRHGERVLLEGPSGGGKSTLASLLCGMRFPESGLLLVDGLDHHTVGAAGWRHRIAAAPQFHENHILTETLAFNLLMGRPWPPTSRDFDDALSICRGLGLNALIEAMPSGLMQMVGESGWQLSHGERSRVYIARALLQQSELVVLDESFAALDPENLRTALEFTIASANSLLVIAHP